MARRLNLPPTKSALLELRRRVVFLEEGYALLDRKRELLTRLVYERLQTYRALRAKTQTALAEGSQKNFENNYPVSLARRLIRHRDRPTDAFRTAEMTACRKRRSEISCA